MLIKKVVLFMSDNRESSESGATDARPLWSSAHVDEVEAEVVEEEVGGGSLIRTKGIYLLPNLFTTASLFSAFYAIVAGMNGDFDKAAVAI